MKSGMNKRKKPCNLLNYKAFNFTIRDPYDTKLEPFAGGFEAAE